MTAAQIVTVSLPLLGCAAKVFAQTDDPGWALRPLDLPPVPGSVASTPIDAFTGPDLSPRADRRTLIRRASFDLTGLPPTPGEVEAFVDDRSTGHEAFAKVIDRLLASPRYGERWARHWMDAVRYAETHGHDEDAIRDNAWPYRDYLINAFNDDKPYALFVKEQVAGEVLFPDDPWATVATGFLACGPWDESSQMGIQDGTRDKLVAQYLDRDDMITATMSTFTSTTAHCSRCHDHKFDPIPTADYYALQAVFAGVDRVDIPVDFEAGLAARRRQLEAERDQIEARTLTRDVLDGDATRAALREWEAGIVEAGLARSVLHPSAAESEQGATLTVQGDGSVLSEGQRPEKDTYLLSASLPGSRLVTAVQLEVLTHDSLFKGGPGRQDNGNLHLSEIVIELDGTPRSIVRAFADFDQAGWESAKAIDGNLESAWGIFPQVGQAHAAVFVLERPVEAKLLRVHLMQLHGGGHLIGRPRLAVTSTPEPELGAPLRPELIAALKSPPAARQQAEWDALTYRFLSERNASALAALDKPSGVYAVASDFDAKGNFKAAGSPREVHVLNRGSVDTPGAVAEPGALSCVDGIPARFAIDDPHDEGARRAALAEWLASDANVLTWRSIANRIWHLHFGRGIVTTPNDFGVMGARPSHPELLDWLAYQLRAHNGSLKWLHREICNSDTYAQGADGADGAGGQRFVTPRKLDAESVRDAVLQISGKLDLTMGGPSARQFHASKGVHVTPNLDYLGFDPDDPANFRRCVYRFVFRTVPDPLMAALDCPDASQIAPKREESVTALQALAMMNNRFLVRQCEHIAARLERERETLDGQLALLFELAYSRRPRPGEIEDVAAYAAEHGLANACRVIINSSEFVFVR